MPRGNGYRNHYCQRSFRSSTAANASATTLCGPGQYFKCNRRFTPCRCYMEMVQHNLWVVLLVPGQRSNVAVNATTTYFVRAEGACNTTTCASVTITVNTQPAIFPLQVPRVPCLSRS
ncbi:MAG: hypothetical protein IPG38_11575 [Chitinophagaceae bacterium]|nr:hypothetical protein [Chitinophagaceae bacterium]